MKHEEKKIILPSSPEAAEYRTDIKGWVSRNGLFVGKNEYMARYRGATHIPCNDCGVPVPKPSIRCKDCAEKRERARYQGLEKKPWEGDAPIYSDAYGVYLHGWDEVDDLMEEHGADLQDLRLLICEEMEFPELVEEYFCQALVEDEDTPTYLLDAIEEFNEKLRGRRSGCYYPTNYALEVK